MKTYVKTILVKHLASLSLLGAGILLASLVLAFSPLQRKWNDDIAGSLLFTSFYASTRFWQFGLLRRLIEVLKKRFR